MKFWTDDDTEVAVRWYRAEPEAKSRNGWSRFGPIGRERESDVEPGDLGEQLKGAEVDYDRGFNDGAWTGQHFEGDQSAWEQGGTHGVDPVIETDSKGGTEHCPWNGPPGPVVMATCLHMAGQVIAVASPLLFSRLKRSGEPDSSWNRQLLEAVQRWCVAKGIDAPSASPDATTRWLWWEESPYHGDYGGRYIDYRTDELQEELRTQLRGVSALVMGFYVTPDFQELDDLNSAIIDIVHDWLCQGGVLILVGSTAGPDDDWPHWSNAMLDYMNVPMRFEHRDQPGGSTFTLNAVEVAFHKTDFTPPAVWATPADVMSHYPATLVGTASGPRGIFSFINVDSAPIPRADGSSLRRIRGAAWFAFSGGWTFLFQIGVQVPGSGFVIWSVTHLQATGTLTRYPVDFEIPFVTEWPEGYDFLWSVEMIATCSTAGTFTFAHEPWQLEFDGPYGPGSPPTLNNRHDLVEDDDGIYLESVDVPPSATIKGGDWVIALPGVDAGRPAGQVYLPHLRVSAIGSAAAPNPHGAGAVTLAQLVAAGVGMGSLIDPAGAGSVVLLDLVAAGVGVGDITDPAGSGAVVLLDLVAAGVGTMTAPYLAEFTSDGTWTCPEHVYLVNVLCRGGGGGGGNLFGDGPGSGGGGGAVAIIHGFATVPGTGYTVQVAFAVSGGVNGNSSSFNTISCVALGGFAGTEIGGGAGGSAGSSVGDEKYDGGQGYQPLSGEDGGGGGSAAGDSATGNNPFGRTGATAPTGGGGGGDGGFSGAGGSDGVAPGGGGGGGGYLTSASPTGGGGARGNVVIFVP